jgi:hypothetical protein
VLREAARRCMEDRSHACPAGRGRAGLDGQMHMLLDGPTLSSVFRWFRDNDGDTVMQQLHRNVASGTEIEDVRRDLSRCRVLLPIQTDGRARSAVMN